MLAEFCPPHEMQKLEEEFWSLKQIGGDNLAYTTRFKQLSILVPHLVNTPERAIAKYIKGLPSIIRDSVTVAEPDTLVKTIRLAVTLSDNRVRDSS